MGRLLLYGFVALLLSASAAEHLGVKSLDSIERDAHNATNWFIGQLSNLLSELGWNVLGILVNSPESFFRSSDPPTAGSDFSGYVWSHDPLSIYVAAENGVDPSHISTAKRAVTDWQTRLRSKVGVPTAYPTDRAPFGIRFVNDQRADVSVLLKVKASGEALGVTTVSYLGSTIKKAVIEIAIRSSSGIPLEGADIYNVAAHEFGHAIGLPHSSDRNDLMYPKYDFARVNYTIPPSTCDLEMVVLLYRADGFAAPNSPSALSTSTCASRSP